MKKNSIVLGKRNKLYVFALIVISLFILLGIISRISPLLDFHGRLSSAPCDDGYYMLTVARNIALEKGVSTSNGTVPTNGVQPLCAFMYSIFYWLVGGNKTWGIVLILIYQTIISTIAAASMYFFVKKVLAQRRYGNEIAVLSSAIWFSSCWVVLQSTNFLETGTYVLFILLSVAYFFKKGFPKYDFSFYTSIKLGIILGVTFLCRNDAIFLVGGMFFFLVIKSMSGDQERFFSMVKRLLMIGLAFTVIASPWLLYNQLNFDNIVPISGQGIKQADIYLNLRVFPKAVLENILLNMPNDFNFNKTIFYVVSVYMLIICSIVYLLKKARDFSGQEKDVLLLMSFFFFPLSIYYSTLSTSYYFFNRYIFIFSPFFAVVTITFIYSILVNFRSTHLLNSIIIIVFLGSSAMNIMLFTTRTDNGHTKLAHWVKKNVPANVLVGAFQSGTIGYFHDNTINLDGVVNAHAFEAIQYDLKYNLIPDKPEQSKWYKYMRAQDIQYLIDWSSLLLDFSGEDPKSAIKGYELIHMSSGFAVLEKEKRK